MSTDLHMGLMGGHLGSLMPTFHQERQPLPGKLQVNLSQRPQQIKSANYQLRQTQVSVLYDYTEANDHEPKRGIMDQHRKKQSSDDIKMQSQYTKICGKSKTPKNEKKIKGK